MTDRTRARYRRKIRKAVADYRLTWEGREFSVGASNGLVRVYGSFAEVAAVLAAADTACYRAKHKRRNRVVMHGD